MTGYALILLAHSYLRWVVLLLVLIVIARSVAGAVRGRDWPRPDDRLHTALVAAVDTQFLLGAWLLVVASPISAAFFVDMPVGMRQPLLRFFGLEHPLGMLIAVSLVHVGRTRSKKAASPAQRHKRVWTWTLAAALAMAASIPWPFLQAGRPLLRGLSAAQGLQPGAVFPLQRAPRSA